MGPDGQTIGGARDDVTGVRSKAGWVESKLLEWWCWLPKLTLTTTKYHQKMSKTRYDFVSSEI
jgi:hypothetical protein